MSQVRGGAEFGVQVTLVIKTADIEEIQSLRKQWDEIDTSDDIRKMIETIGAFEDRKKVNATR
ncbi:MAG TPA: hypothetical protein VFC84_02000 [Desulfosporosinus sp.]|nr:hypothetical protein [Desulfosporosinus sp.]